MIPIRDDAPRSTFPYVNYFLIALNTVVFLFEYSLGRHLQMFLNEFALTPARVDAWLPGALPVDAAIVPIFSSMFLHASSLHLISDMWSLAILRDNFSDRLGH